MLIFLIYFWLPLFNLQAAIQKIIYRANYSNFGMELIWKMKVHFVNSGTKGKITSKFHQERNDECEIQTSQPVAQYEKITQHSK